MKKILIALGILALMGIAVFLAWPYLRGSTTPNTVPPPPPTSNTPEESGLTLLSPQSMFSYWVTTSGSIVAITEEGKVLSIEGGKETALTDSGIESLHSVASSPNGNFAAVSFGSGPSPIFSIFDVEKKSWQPLPVGTNAAAFDTAGNRIAYLRMLSGITSLNFYDIKTKKSTEVIKLHEEGLDLAWPAGSKIYLSEKPSAKALGNVWSFDTATRSLTPFVSNEPGLMTKWAPNGKAVLKFINSFKENILSVISDKAQPVSQLNVTTLPSKCVFESATILYCAVPHALPEGTLLPDDYLKRKVYSEDDILKFDLTTNTASLVFAGNTTSIDAINLSVQGTKLYFMNRYTNKLYSLEISK